MKELQRRTVGLLVLSFSIIALILILDHNYTSRLNEHKRLLMSQQEQINVLLSNKRIEMN